MVVGWSLDDFGTILEYFGMFLDGFLDGHLVSYHR